MSGFIDYENLPAPTEGILVTYFLTVRSVARSLATSVTPLVGSGRGTDEMILSVPGGDDSGRTAR